MNNKTEIAVIIPVYNEEEIVSDVILDWTEILNTTGASYKIHAYNDGSGDKSYEILFNLSKSIPHLIVHNKKNEGHGPTILKGYRENIDCEWIFQTDSDNEMRPEYFQKLWEKRHHYDFLIGRRENRFQPAARKVVSLISRMTVNLFYKKGVWDVNSPFRLMRTSALKDIILKIPGDTFAPNVIISGMACLKKTRIFEISIPHTNRQTGSVSLNKIKLVTAALNSFFQTIVFRYHL